MALYLWRVSYTTAGAEGLLAQGGTARRAAIQKSLESLGGTLESFHYALGEDDAYLVGDLPDGTSAAALSLRVAAAGGARVRTVPLLTPEEMDEATKRGVSYSPPGS
jgi:uncharacterized protein with GYD domain